MERFIEALINVIQPPWNYIFGVVALLIVVIPRLLELRHNFLDARIGRRQLEFEKLRLEVLKLRVEIQKITGHPEFPGPAPALEAVAPAPAPRIVRPEVPLPESPGWFRRLLQRYPLVGRPVAFLVQIVVAYMMVMFGVLAVAVPFATWDEPDMGVGGAIGVAILYALFAWAFYRWYVRIRAIRKELSVI